MKTKHSFLLLFLTLLATLSGCIFGGDPTEEHLKNARAYTTAGYHGAAALELKKTLDAVPDHVPSLLLLDEITTGPNKNKDMLPYLSRAHEAGVKNYKILYKLTEAYLEQKQFQNAQLQIWELLSLQLDSDKKISLDVLNAKVLVGLSDFSDAEDLYSALLNNPATLKIAQLGLAQLAIKRIHHAIPYHPSHLNIQLPGSKYLFPPQIRIEYTQLTETDKEHLFTGMENVKKVLEIFPDNLEGNLIQAEIYYLQGSFTQATKSANHSLTIDLNNTQALFILAKSNIAQGYYLAAEHDLLQLLALEKSNLDASNTLVSLYLRQGNTKDSKTLLNHFLKQGIKDEDLYINMGILRAIKNEPEKSIDYFKHAVKTFPNSAYSHAQLGTADLKMNQHKLAIKEFKQAHINDLDNLEISLALIESNLIIGDYNTGLRIARSLPGQHPDASSAYHMLGIIYETQGEIDRARKQYNKALSINLRYSPSRIHLSRIALNDNQISKAEDLLNEGLKLAPEHLNLSIELALLEAYKNKPDKAAERLISLSKKNPHENRPRTVLGQLYLNNGNINKAIKIKNKLNRLDPLPPEVIKFMGDTYIVLGNYARAVAMYKILVNKIPGNPYHHLDLGKALIKNGSLSSARVHLQKAVDVFGNQSLSSLISFTQLEMQQNNFDAARVNIKKILKIKQELTEGIILYGDLLLSENKINKAIKIYSKALNSNKKIEAIQKISLAYLQSNNKNKANNFLKKWSRTLPDNSGVSLTYINYYQQSGKIELAKSEAQRFIKLQPDNGMILNKLAQLSLNSDKNIAWNFAQRAYEISPEIPEILDTYGSLCITRGRNAEGLDALKQAVSGAPSTPAYQYHFAKGLAQSGKSNSAKEILKLALANKNPFSERAEAKTMLASLEDSFFN